MPPVSTTPNWPRCGNSPAEFARLGSVRWRLADAFEAGAGVVDPQHRALFVPVAQHDALATAAVDIQSVASAGRWVWPWISVSMPKRAKVPSTAAGATSVIVSIVPWSCSPSWCALLAARACCANASRAASGCARNCACHCGFRVCARNAW